MSTTEPLSGIRACLFDVYGTLFDVHAPVSARLTRVGDPGVARALSDTWRRKQLEYTWLRTVMDDHADFWTVTGQALDYAMASVGLTDKVLRARLMEAYLSLPAFPDAVPTLEVLNAANPLRQCDLGRGRAQLQAVPRGLCVGARCLRPEARPDRLRVQQWLGRRRCGALRLSGRLDQPGRPAAGQSAGTAQGGAVQSLRPAPSSRPWVNRG